jgi:hypothetical protein
MTQPHATPTAGPADPAAVGRRAAGARGEEPGVGWLVFAAIVLALVGVMNVIYGIAAIGSSSFYVQDAHYVAGDLNAYGWLLAAVGAIQFGAALGILAFAQWARWVGVAAASVNAIVQLLVMPAAPFLALALFTVDVLVVYGLVAYGGRWRST